MEASPLPTSDAKSWAEQFDQSLKHQRQRVREFLTAQQTRLKRVEDDLARQLQQLANQLGQNRSETQRTREELQERGEQLARETQTVEALQQELAARQAEWERLQQRARSQQEALAEQIRQQCEALEHRHEELARRRSEIDAAEEKLADDRRALQLAQAECEDQREQLEALRQRLDAQQAELQTQRGELDAQQGELQTRQAELDAQQADLDAARADTQSQRRRIAREFKHRRHALLKELDRRRADLDRRDSQQQAELSEQLDNARKTEIELNGRLASLQNKCRQLEQALSDRSAESETSSEQLQSLKAERDDLLARLAEAQQQTAEAIAPADDDEAVGQWERRYQAAMDDVRQLQAANAELQQRLARTPAAGPPAEASASGNVLDWEAEKQRILAALEADSGENDDEEQAAERLELEKVVQTTDRALAEKDREINELRKLLESQSGNLGSVAVGAAALGEMLDADALIQEERGSLKKLQEEWREKLRQAEIEISVERAKIAREKAEIEEKRRGLQEQGTGPDDPSGDSDRCAKPARGRWRAKLGLGDPQQE